MTRICPAHAPASMYCWRGAERDVSYRRRRQKPAELTCGGRCELRRGGSGASIARSGHLAQTAGTCVPAINTPCAQGRRRRICRARRARSNPVRHLRPPPPSSSRSLKTDCQTLINFSFCRLFLACPGPRPPGGGYPSRPIRLIIPFPPRHNTVGASSRPADLSSSSLLLRNSRSRRRARPRRCCRAERDDQPDRPAGIISARRARPGTRRDQQRQRTKKL